MENLVLSSFLKLRRRADGVERETLVETFVNVGPLLDLLSSKDHQILYGRRGTGKTHALTYLGETMQSKGDVTVYIDLRTSGSTGGIYSDKNIPIAERATRLLVDTLSAIHDGLYDYATGNSADIDLSAFAPPLDRFAESITKVVVVGDIEQLTLNESTESTKSGVSLGAELSAKTIGITANSTAADDQANRKQLQTKVNGQPRHRVHFGEVSGALSDIIVALGGKQLWILLDEWSAIPVDLQPYLADLIRRCILPRKGVTVKIGAIEKRSQFMLHYGNEDYIGIELGADAAADLNLDDFMVFDNDPQKAVKFFQELLYKHYRSLEGVDLSSGPQSSTELLQGAFTQRNAFEEFVRAAEGVPRDFINILILAVQKDIEQPISVNAIRVAARTWYQRDKENSIQANGKARNLLTWIIDEVIAHRRARAFLLSSSERHELIDALFDWRVLHFLKKNISGQASPGVRYDAYKLDYGCYVDLINTAKAPQGALPFKNEADGREGYVDVPPDDWRSIRRAILDLHEFDRIFQNTTKTT